MAGVLTVEREERWGGSKFRDRRIFRFPEKGPKEQSRNRGEGCVNEFNVKQRDRPDKRIKVSSPHCYKGTYEIEKKESEGRISN